MKTFGDFLVQGIYMVGPCKATQPFKEINRPRNSWPFQIYYKCMAPAFSRGWMRHCCQKVTDDAGTLMGILHASVWLDIRFLFILSTVHISPTREGNPVLRWRRSEFKRNPITAPLAVIFYQKRMNAVDIMDKVCHCRRRKVECFG